MLRLLIWLVLDLNSQKERGYRQGGDDANRGVLKEEGRPDKKDTAGLYAKSQNN